MMISFVVPSYNTKDYIERCLDSIVAQCATDYEIICIDDSSSDGSWELLNSYEMHNEFFHLFRNDKNYGLSYTRNRGIDLAKGDYIWFVDSDDYIMPESLKKIGNIIKTEPIDILYFGYKETNEDDTVVEEYGCCLADDPSENSYIITGKDYFFRRVRAQKKGYLQTNAVWRAVWRTDFLKNNDIRFEEGIYHEDIVFSFHSLLKAQCVFQLDECLYVYQGRKGSITSAPTKRNAQSIFHSIILILSMWNSCSKEFTKEENDLLFFYCGLLFRTYKKYAIKTNCDSQYSYGSFAESFLYHMICQDIYSFRPFEKTIWEQIDQSKNIWIYGAGAIGIEVSHYLVENGKDYKGFLVSDISDNSDEILFHPVVEISDAYINKDDVIIIAVSEKNRKIVMSKLSFCEARKIELSF